jgi:hypothetical protein
MKEVIRKIFFVISLITLIGSIGIIIWYYTYSIKEKKAIGGYYDSFIFE